MSSRLNGDHAEEAQVSRNDAARATGGRVMSPAERRKVTRKVKHAVVFAVLTTCLVCYLFLRALDSAPAAEVTSHVEPSYATCLVLGNGLCGGPANDWALRSRVWRRRVLSNPYTGMYVDVAQGMWANHLRVFEVDRVGTIGNMVGTWRDKGGVVIPCNNPHGAKVVSVTHPKAHIHKARIYVCGGYVTKAWHSRHA